MTDQERTRLIVNKAYIQVLSREMDYFDARFTDHLVDKLVEEIISLKLKDLDNAKFDYTYANDLIDEYKYKISAVALQAYGWTPNDVKRTIIKHLPEDYKIQFQSQNEGEM